VREVRTPSEEGFLAAVEPVDDPAFENLTAAGLRTEQADGPFVSFLADERTLCDAEHPILAVWVWPGREYEPFRVVPGALWSVENNINVRNLDWWDYTDSADEDGVFRGF
jgi:hypothetical protein